MVLPDRCLSLSSSWIRGALYWAVVSLSPMAMALDLSDAYEAALTQDSGIRAARAAAEAGRERLPQARSQWLPNVSLNAGRNSNKLDASSPNLLGAIQTSQSAYYSQNQSLTLRQTVFNEAKSADYRQAGFQVADSDALLAHELQNLTIRVGEAYFGALLAEDQLALLLSQETLVRTQLDAAKKLFESGAGTRTDIDEVQARLDLNTAQLLEARQSVDYAQQLLSVLMNQPVAQLAPLDATSLDFSPLQQPISLIQWQAQADQSSPELQILEARQQAARLQIEKNRAGHLPTVDVVAQWSSSDSEYVTQLNTNYNTRSLGIQLSLPLFAGGYVNSMVRQAIAEHVRSQEMLEVTRRDLHLRLHKEFRGVTEGVLRVKALEQAVHSAGQVVISSEKSAQAGLRTQLDILKAEALKMESMRDLAQARYTYLLSKLRLAVLAGMTAQNSINDINGYLLKNR